MFRAPVNTYNERKEEDVSDNEAINLLGVLKQERDSSADPVIDLEEKVFYTGQPNDCPLSDFN